MKIFWITLTIFFIRREKYARVVVYKSISIMVGLDFRIWNSRTVEGNTYLMDWRKNRGRIMLI